MRTCDILSIAVTLAFLASCALGERLSKDEIEDLKRRLAVVREETVREARKIAEVRKVEAQGVGPEFAACVSGATSELESGVVLELESRIGVLERELEQEGELEREELRRKVELATVGAGVAVERRTTAFIKTVFACTRRQLEASQTTSQPADGQEDSP
uniref:Ankyrin repeat and KH domain-containing protein 1 n=1 Tax=Lygus hesperus TaxID=30085 RepID=A0A0A9W986_LYGHE